ncbi:TIGR00725 family protein [Desulfohalovibrio reitneri]|uniref:TIGR00725 family protein n=1 Tax=Desulfohalovibrio reitneri TaxID=1307759 RepID=UPI0004A6C9F7|nr:TIGR00725 family protein [Desulfohalovibrio reitneri]
MNQERYIAVIGDGSHAPHAEQTAKKLGQMLADAGFTLVSGGLKGVMSAASEGARERGGHTVGLLPGLDREDANEFIEVPVVTGLGHMRNFLVVANADLVIAVEGGWGTLSELALAKKIGKTVIAIGRWSSIDGVLPADDPAMAVDLAKKCFAEEY